jgi:serine/threonine-protein kinase
VIGQTLDGQYEILRLLGEGGMGAVYEAVRKDDGRHVAVKVIGAEHLAKSGEVRARFSREMRAASAIETRHIVQTLDSGSDAETGQSYLVMELLTGEDFQQILERLGVVSEDFALRVAAQACVGLQRAHDAGIVHRDVKPANLFLARLALDQQLGLSSLAKTLPLSGSAGRPLDNPVDAAELIVKVLDFGIAKLKMDQLGAESGTLLTRTGSMLGTPLYMSPEQAKGLKTIDHRTDLWSLGAVLYQAISGEPPHYQDTVGQLIISICSGPPRPVQDVAPWVSPGAAAIVHRALRIDPAERYPSASAMLEDIGRLLGSGWTITPELVAPVPEERRKSIARRVVISAPEGLEGRNPEEAGVLSTTYMRTTSGVVRLPSLPPTRRKMAGVALLGGAAVAGAIGAYAMFGRSQDAPPPPTPATAPTGEVVAPAVPTTATPPNVVPDPVRRVRLAVPEGAAVTVEGRSLEVVSSAVELSGALGSKHRVVVHVGKTVVEQDVVVTEDGAFPARIELPRAGKPAAPATSSKSGQQAATATTATAKPQHATTFE